MRESGILKRFISLLTCLLIVMSTVGDVSGVFVPASSPLRLPGTNITSGLTQSLSESSRTVVLSNVKREADPSTMDTYKSMLDFTDDTRYIGRLWSDKTVFAYNYPDAGGDANWDSATNTLTLNEEDDGLNGSVELDSGFLHVFSALGSSEQITEVVLPAVDLVILLDMSGSMAVDMLHTSTGHVHENMEERIADSRLGSVLVSINAAIDALMQKNDTNRVAVIGYGATAATILPLGHYEKINGEPYLTAYDFTTYASGDNNSHAFNKDDDLKSGAYTVKGHANKVEYDKNGNQLSSIEVTNKVRNNYVLNNEATDRDSSITLVGYHTDLQAGIYQGFNELYKDLNGTDDVTYTYHSTVKNEDRTVQRVPIAFVMTDGGSNYALKAENSPNGGTGDEWREVPIAKSVSNPSNYGGNIKKYRAENNASEGKNGGDAVILDILLTASYMKSKVENKYTELLQQAGLLGEDESADFQIHTISVDTPTVTWQIPRVYAALDPVDYFNSDGGKNMKDPATDWSQRNDITKAFDEFGKWQEKGKDEYITVDFKDSDSKDQKIKFNGYDDTVDAEVPKSDIIRNINYNDSFADITAGDLTNHFEDLIAKFYEPTFIPAAGGNDLGVKDSVTYVDPIGKYMEVKDVKGLSLFGSYYGIVETAEYNWQFNDDYIRGHGGTAGSSTFTEGWYRGESGTDADFAGQEGGKAKLPTDCADSNAAWAAGWVYRVSSDTAAQFVPSLEAIKTSDPDDKIKHTTYRFFRIDTVTNSEGTKTLDADARDVVNMNPAYGKTFPNSYKEDKYQETPGAYKLSDLRIWVEDSGDYSDSSIEDSGSKTDANFDEALYINIPVNMLPLRTVNIDLSQVDPSKPTENSKYTTNQMYLRSAKGEYKNKNETDGNVASFPLRVFYTVGIEDDYIKENNIDLTGVSLEYLNENRANTQAVADARGIKLGSVEFFSNWYNPAARYSDYATTQTDYTFGDPMISFSPSTDNRYYIFEKALPIYDAAYVYTGGQWRRVAINETIGSADSQTFLPADFGGKLLAQDLEIEGSPTTESINVALLSKGINVNDKKANYNGTIVLLKDSMLDNVTKPEKEGDKDPFSSDAYYFFAIEYYTKNSKGGADPVQYVITRKGSEFGSAYHTSGITNGDMLVWHDLSGQYPDYPYLSYSETQNASRGKDFIGVELDENTGYYKGLDKSSHQIPQDGYDKVTSYKSEMKEQGQWVVATKPGGLRVGALAQAVQQKPGGFHKYEDDYVKTRFPDSPKGTRWGYYDSNITRTANNYYLPTISSSSQVGADDVIVNVYLGNNGRLEVQDTELLLTKLVESPLSGAEPDPDKEFDFQVYIKGFTQDEQAIVVRYNPETQNWQRQLHYIDLELSANLFLQTSDGNLVLVDKTGKRVIRSYGATYDEGSGTYKYKYTYADGGEYNPTDGGPYYVYIGTNTNSSADIKAPVTGLRVFHNDAVDSNGSVSPEDVKAEFYKKAEPGKGPDTKLDTEQFTDWNAISGADYVKFSKKVYLFTQTEYDKFSGTSDLTGKTAIDNFELVKVSFDSQSDMITIDSDYRTSSAYWRETVPFGTRPATDEEIAAQKADENGRIKLQATDLCFPDNVNAEPENTAVVKLRSGWGLIFSSLQHGTNYALVEHLGDNDLEQGYSFGRIEHVQQSPNPTTKTAADFANAEKPHEHDYYVSGDTAGEGETKIEEGHFFNVWNLLKDETAVNGDEVEKNEETGLYPPVNVGDEITYTIKWANHTDEDGEVRITDFLDTGVDFVEAGMVPGESENPQYVYGSGKATAARPSFSGTTDDGRYAYSVEYDPESHSVTWIIGSNSGTTAAGDKTFGTAVVDGKVAKGDFGTVTLTVRVNDKAEKTWSYGSDSGTGAPGDGEDNLVHNRATVAVGDNSYTTNIVTNPCGTPDKNEIKINEKEIDSKSEDGDGVYDPDKNLWEGPAVHVGDIIEYEITFDNNIAEPAVITVTDPLDPNVSFVEAQIGNITLKSGQTHASGEISLTYTKEDGTPATVYNVPADIWLRERDGVTYVIWGIGSVTEQMPSYDKEFNASHAIPVPPTATGKATLKVKVEEGALVPHQVKNHADVQVGNSRTVRTKTVENKLPEPEKTEVTPGDGKQVEVGEEITYKITWQNRNATPAVVTVTDPLDIGVDFLEAAVGDALLNYSSTEYKGNVTIGDASVPVTIKYENHTVTWTFGEESGVKKVPGNSSGEVILKVRVNEKAVQKWTYNNENDGGSEGAGKDYEVVNRASVKVGNDVQLTDIVENPVPEKTEEDGKEDKPLQVGDNVTYKIHWKNGYDRPAKVVVTDPLDKGVDFVSASYDSVELDALNTTTAGSVTFDGVSVPVGIKFENGTVTWTIGDDDTKVPAGASGDVSLIVKVNKDAIKTWSYKEGTGTDGDNTNDYRIVNRARVEVDNQGAYTAEVENPVPEKTEADPGEDMPVNVGDVVTYNIGWKNTADNGTAITVTDKLDPGVDFVSAGMLEGLDDELYVYGGNGITADSRTYTGVTSEGYAYSITYNSLTHTVTWTIGKNGNSVGTGGQQLGGELVTPLPAGAYGVLTLTVKVNENAVKTWSYDEASEDGKDHKIVNRAEIKVGNDSVTTTDVENPVPEKTETDPGDGKLVGVGEVITYEISWSNTEDKDATVTITDPLDIGVDFASASYGGVTLDKLGTVEADATVNSGDKQHVKIEYDAGSHTVAWTIAGAAPGESGKVTLKVKVNEKAVRQWSYSESDNSGTGDAGEKDYEVVNRAEVKVDNKATFTATVENPVPEKTETAIDGKAVTGEYNVNNRTWTFDEVEVGQTITYSIHYKNVHDTAANVEIVDELDNGVDFVTAEPASKYSYDGVTRKVTWTLDNVPAHSEGDVTLTVRVNHNATITEQVENSASVTVNDVTKQTEKVVNPTPHGSFKVTKTVENFVAADENDEFTFTVKFEPKDNGTLWFSHEESGKTKTYTMIEDAKGGEKTQDNKITFKLKAGETAEFYNLPVGTAYTVTEFPDKVSGKYTAEWSYNGEGAVKYNVFENSIVKDVEGTINSVVFTNTRRKTGLTLTKVVKNGLPSDNDTVFKFTIELDYEGNDYTGDIKITGENAHGLGNGKYAAELKNGGTVKLSDLPTGVQFKITEDNNNSYDAVVKVEINGERLESIGDGWYRIDDENADITVEYTNTKHSGEIKVTKTVEGEDTSEDFSFTLQLFDTDGTELTSDKIAAYSITYKKSTGENGKVTEIPYVFTLRHGENIIFSGIPIGTKYTVTEERGDGNKYLVFTGESHGPEDEKNIVSGDVSEALSEADFYNKPRTIPEKTEIDPHDGDTVYPGDKITYNIKWYNNYDAEADVTITDELDPDVEFVEASDNGSYDSKTNTVTWTFTADANTSGTVTLIVKVREDALDRSIVDPDGDDKVENSAGVKVGNTYDVVGTPVNPIADLSIEKLQGVEHHIAPTKDEFSVDDGYIVTYYLHIVPEGDSGATLKNVTVRDVTPSGLELVPGSEKYGKDIASLRGVSAAGTDTPHYTEVGDTVYWFIGDITLSTDPDDFWVSYNVKVPYADDYTEWTNKGEVRHGNEPVDPDHPDPDGWKRSNEVKIHEEHTQLSIEKEVEGAVEGDENREFTLKIEFFTDADFTTPLEKYEFPYTTMNLPSQENSGIMLTSSPYDEYGKHTGYLTPDNTTVIIKHRQIVNIYELPADTAVYYRVTEVLGDASGDFEVSITGGGSVTEGVVTGLIDKMDPAKLKFINTRVPYEPEKTEAKINDTDVNMPSDPGEIWEGPGVTVGDEITYTIRWKNYEAQTATVIITDKLDEGVDFVSADNEGSYNGDTHTVKWIIPNVEPGVSGTVTLTVKVNEKAVKDDKTVENSALVKVGNENEQKTNTVTNEVKTGNLSITKKLEGDVINEDKEIGFEFTVTLKDGSDNDLTGAYSYDVTSSDGTIAESGTITSGGKITVKADQTATIKDLPEGTKYTVVEEPNADFTVTYGGDGSGSGTILAGENITNSVTATNTRVAPPKMPDIAIHKTQAVNNGVPGEQLMTVNPGDIVTYYIDVTNTGEAPAENVVVKDAVPEGLTYIEGTAKVVTEGIECDITPPNAERTIYWAFKNELLPGETVRLAFDVTVPAVDSETHWFNIAAVKYDKPDEPHDPDEPDNPDEPDDPWTPSNEVETVEYVGEIRLTKSVENYAEGSTYEFTFRISLFHDEQLSVPVTEMNGLYGAYDYQNGVTTVSFTVSSGAWPTAQIGGIPVGLWYSIDEIEAGGYIPDFELGGSIGKITDAVTPVTISVVNREPAPENAVLTIEGIKNLDGKPSSEVFGFTIEGKLAPEGVDPIPMPENTTVKNGPDGKFYFGPIKYTVAGDYVYEIREIIPDPDDGKYIYDTTVYSIKVKVTENAGDLSAEIVYYATVIDGMTVPALTPSLGGGIVFNNKTVTPTGGLSITKVVKSSDGSVVSDSTLFDFTVKLEAPEGAALPAAYVPDAGKDYMSFRLTAGQSLTFSNLPVGTKYYINEVGQKDYTCENPEVNGVITEENKTVEVKIVNIQPEPEVVYGSLTLTKTVVGEDSGTPFIFTVGLSKDGAPLEGEYPYTGTVSGVISNGGTVSLGSGESVTVTGLPVGTNYTITESASDYTVTADVDGIPADVVSGTVSGGITAAGTTVHYTNTKTPPPPPVSETGSLTLTKTVVGEDSGTPFIFTIGLSKDGAPLEGEYPYTGTVSGVISNGGTVNLCSGESVTITGLPVGTNYTIAESASDYTVTADVDGVPVSVTNGTVSGGVTAVGTTVHYTNTKTPPPPPPVSETGSLTVAKTVQSPDPSDYMRPFGFAVQLSDPTVNGVYGDMMFTNGTAYITLMSGQSLTASGLPAGISYSVYETDAYGFTVLVNGMPSAGSASGMILSGSVNFEAFTNISDIPEPEYGGLTVTKTVEGSGADYEKYFTFTVTLGEPLTGQYGQMYFNAGTATFTLKHGESCTASGIPAGTSYSVTESDNEGYEVTSVGEVGTVMANTVASADFVNTREEPEGEKGGLTVRKIVTGRDGDQSKEFTFTVTLGDSLINGTYGGMTFVNGTASFTLRHGESLTASGLPADVSYTVTETDNEGYTVVSLGDTGTIPANGEAVAEFVNSRGEFDEFGDLTVAKFVTGFGIDYQNFTFTVTLSAPITGQYGQMFFNNGVAVFTLKHGETATATGLPAGVSYSVTESNNDYYIVSSTGENGIIVNNGSAYCEYVNYLTEEDRPKVLELLDMDLPLIDFNPPTGNNYSAAGLLLVVAAIGVIVKRRKER